MIRLARMGARKQPYYRVVVIEKERARNGRSLEIVGTYNPRTTPASVDLKRERIEHWLSKGAKLSETVSRLFSDFKKKQLLQVKGSTLVMRNKPALEKMVHA